MQNLFTRENAHPQEKLNIADLLKGDALLKLLAKLEQLGIFEWDSERSLAMVVKRSLTAVAGSTEEAQGLRAWLKSQGFRGSRRSRSFYLSLSDLEGRGVTIVDGKFGTSEPKVRQGSTRKPKASMFGDIFSMTA